MKKYWKVIGITAVAAGLLVYPAMKLYQYIAKKRAEDRDKEPGDEHKTKPFLHHMKHTPHHRAAHNGHTKTAL